MKGVIEARRTLRHPYWVLVLTMGLCLATESVVAAHSILVRSDPPADVTLEVPPHQVRVSFSEPIDSTFSSLTVLDSHGAWVSSGTMISEDRRRMATGLGPPSQGVFTVKWRVLSAVDGHTTSGVFIYAVGQPVSSGLGKSGGVTAPSPIQLSFRWIALLATLLLAGSTIFPLAVLRPGLPNVDQDEVTRMRATLTHRLQGLKVGSALVLLLSAAAEWRLTAMTLFDNSYAEVLSRGLLWPLLVGTRMGWSALVRMPLAALLVLPGTRRGEIIQSMGLVLSIGIASLAVLFRGPAAIADESHVGHLTVLVGVTAVYGLVHAVRQPPKVNWMPLLAVAGILGGMTLTAHASGGGGLAMVADWLHLVAAGAWIGGVASLFIVLRAEFPERAQLLKVIVPQFSKLAGLSLAVLLVTGGYSAWLHVPALQAFVITEYGEALLAKLLLVLPLITLGVVNHFVIRPRLLTLTGPALTRVQRWLRLLVGIEIALGVAALAATAVLTSVPPARVIFSAVTPVGSESGSTPGQQDIPHTAVKTLSTPQGNSQCVGCNSVHP